MEKYPNVGFCSSKRIGLNPVRRVASPTQVNNTTFYVLCHIQMLPAECVASSVCVMLMKCDRFLGSITFLYMRWSSVKQLLSQRRVGVINGLVTGSDVTTVNIFT